MTSNLPPAKRFTRPAAADPARLLAVEALAEIEAKALFANLVLPHLLREKRTSDPKFRFQDAAFTSEIVYGTIRWRGYLDFYLGHLCSRPLNQLDLLVWQCLRVGAYQILFMRVPDHAAVSETVEVARQLCGEAPTKMINGVLRSLLRQTPAQREELLNQIADPLERYATQYSHPLWAVAAFEQALTSRGLPFAELSEVLAANNRTPQVTLVARPGLIEREALLEEAEEVLNHRAWEGEVSPFSVILEGGDPGALSSVREGLAAVQDEGSQLAATILAQAKLKLPNPPDSPDSAEAQEAAGTAPPAELWADLCAGPGGKTALLAALGATSGNKVQVEACEIQAHRAKLVKISTRALDNVSITAADGREFGAPNRYDRVLVDAPCLGLGSLRRRPESRWRHRDSDLDDLLPLQRELFDRARVITKPGGLIAWVTCSPHVSETLDQVKYQVERHGLELLDAVSLAERISPLPLGIGRGSKLQLVADADREIVRRTVQLWPHRNGTDAMFIALLRKPIRDEVNQ